MIKSLKNDDINFNLLVLLSISSMQKVSGSFLLKH